ncbi:MAG: DUF4363 family protein [Clostridia bacterium]|nr:DUF4363 family protein [Clostridia bacterium]
MRDLVIVLVIIALVFGGGYFVQQHLEGTEQELTTRLDELHSEISSGDMNHMDKVEDLENLWESTKAEWHILGNHAEIDEIESELKRLKECYRIGNSEEAMLSLVEIKFRVNDMHKGDKLELANIL